MMADVSTTRMSVKGQVVIPEEIRKRIDLHAGDRFLVVGEGDAVLLQRLRSPELQQFASLKQQAQDIVTSGTAEATAPGGIAIDPSELDALCRRCDVRRLSLFGSVLHGSATSQSDVDMLVEFDEGKKPGLGFFALEEELSALLGRKVDLNTPEFLSADFRDEVLAEAVEIYARA